MKLPVGFLSALLLGADGLVAGQPLDADITSSAGQTRVRSDNTKARAIARATDYIGQEVVNSSEQSLGEIVDLAVHGPQGRVIYAVVASGGLFGIGQDFFAVPIGAFVNQAAGEGDTLMLDIPGASLDAKDAFDADHWPTRPNQSLVEATTANTQDRSRRSMP